MLCMCTPAGQDEYFLRVGDEVAGKDAPPPRLTDDEKASAGTRSRDWLAVSARKIL